MSQNGGPPRSRIGGLPVRAMLLTMTRGDAPANILLASPPAAMGRSEMVINFWTHFWTCFALMGGLSTAGFVVEIVVLALRNRA